MCFIFILFTVNCYSFLMQHEQEKRLMKKPVCKVKITKMYELCNKNQTDAIFVLFKLEKVTQIIIDDLQKQQSFCYRYTSMIIFALFFQIYIIVLNVQRIK